MMKWKNNCINISQNVKNKLEKANVYVKKMKKRIKDERSNTILGCVNTYLFKCLTLDKYFSKNRYKNHSQSF